MSPSLIEFYMAIESTSQSMLEAAQTRDWDQVARCEGACAVLVAQLREQSRVQTLTESERRTKARIMRRILRNDACVRYLVEPWCEDLGKVLCGRFPPRFLH